MGGDDVDGRQPPAGQVQAEFLGDLTDAMHLFHRAGLTALEQRTETGWYEVRVRFPDRADAEATTVEHLGPALDRLRADPGHRPSMRRRR
ncbi:hypothetical protein [Streptosporangium jomthongense]|uniref:Uncharacterized protein n=1 Tax=Streptosporangium jomthongense TaxID=1193683 RepID=A0ABV8F3H3_9ACTN